MAESFMKKLFCNRCHEQWFNQDPHEYVDETGTYVTCPYCKDNRIYISKDITTEK